MTNSTIPAESLGAPSVSASYYRWAPPEKPIEVHLSLDLMERLEREVLESFKAITKRGSEIGGVLVGRTLPGAPVKVVIEQFEPVECEYSRGPLYLLADNDKAKLQAAIERVGKLGNGLGAVGFFRSNTRRELVLDEDDLAIASDHFSNPNQVMLLVRPFAMKPSLAGFFIWEDGRLQEECCLQFPFKRAELVKTLAESIIGTASAPAPPKEPLVMPKREDRTPVAPPAALKREEPRPAAPAAAPPPKREETPLTFKREERAPIIPSSVRREEPRREERAAPVAPQNREERPPVVPVQPKRDERSAGPTLVAKREEATAPPAVKIEEKKEAPPKRDEKPAVTVKREEKPAVTPAAAKREVPAAKTEEKAVPAKQAEAPAPPVKTEARAKAEPEPDLASVFRGPSFSEAAPAEKSGVMKWVLLGLLVVLLAGGGGYFAFQMGRTQQQEAAAPVDSTLALKVERNSGQLFLSWNRASSMIATASRATLLIADGDHKEPVDLDLGQLRTGSIVYSPMTNDVSFRLDITDQSGKTVGESVRVLAGRPSPTVAALPPAAAKPAPAAGEKPATQVPAAQPAESTPEPALEQPTVVAGPAVTADLPKPESLAARLRAAEPQEIPAPPALEAGSTNAITGRAPSSGLTQMAPPPVTQPAPVQAPKPAAQAPAQNAAAAAPRLGGKAQEARLVRSIAPVYPPLARQTRVSGIVRVRAVIGKDGRVKQAAAAAGPPLLRQAATEAVKRWLYNPAMLNGAPVESETQVDVNFMM